MPLTQKTKRKAVRPAEPLPNIPDLGLGLRRPDPGGLPSGVSGLPWGPVVAGAVLKTQPCGNPAAAGARWPASGRPGPPRAPLHILPTNYRLLCPFFAPKTQPVH